MTQPDTPPQTQARVGHPGKGTDNGRGPGGGSTASDGGPQSNANVGGDSQAGSDHGRGATMAAAPASSRADVPWLRGALGVALLIVATARRRWTRRRSSGTGASDG